MNDIRIDNPDRDDRRILGRLTADALDPEQALLENEAEVDRDAEKKIAADTIRRFLFTLNQHQLRFFRARFLAEPRVSAERCCETFGMSRDFMHVTEDSLLERLSVFVGLPRAAAEIRAGLQRMGWATV